MNKEEILKKSREENKDEGMEYTENSGRKFGFTVFCVLVIFLLIFNAFLGKSSYDIHALFWGFMAAEAIPKYKFTGKKTYLVTAVAGGLASVVNIINFVLTSLR